MGKAITSDKIALKEVRAAFANQLFNPEAFEPGKPKSYSCSFLLDPDTPSHAKQIAEIEAAEKALIAQMEWEGVKGIKRYFGGYADEDGKTYDGYEGMFYVTAKRKEKEGRPVVVDRDRSPLTADDGRPYSGSYVNATITLWAYHDQQHGGGRMINANLRAVQFVRDGDEFSGGSPRVNPEDEFDDLGDDATDDTVFG